MSRPPFTPTIAALPKLVPFIGPEAMERSRGRPFRARLGANENIFGPSPKAIAAMHDAVAENWKYSDPENFELRAAIAAHHDVPVECVVVGEGIDGLLGLTCALFLTPGTAVVTTDGAYPTFNFHVLAHGGILHALPMNSLREDVPRLIETATTTSAPLIYVSNPNSPLGSWWSASEMQAFIDALPSGTMLILDEAYCDTATVGTAPSIDVSNPQVIRYRTFSKAYGLAGARIGYAIAEKSIIEAFDKVRNHYGINRVGQIGALAALQDQAYLHDVVGRIAGARDRISEIAVENGFKPLPSGANFVAIDCGGDGAFAARILHALLERDVFVRKPTAKGLDHCIRVSCGRDRDLQIFADALPGARDVASRLP
ncbi:pyridoxal phosphate-dependent aminotransferase [Hyphomicrobium sp.]|jgi:histidinol-phosphate aminotransferase|uniref:pyridoxal phosphate-dependent aminotransferase n=1 Tax=Hyphomicrobium sp. TaxID=82 RepID=UPI002C89FE19|nr:pyridoxal phosphate-dependent aminotransferase [Hyphomicrobium sp.]HVZ04501.1 pyridoxal phosphate-dependent aminotransferase [Hyphomicrobium sp.]